MVIIEPFSQTNVRISTMLDASAFSLPFCIQTEAVDRLASAAIWAAERACKPSSFTMATSRDSSGSVFVIKL
jgi:hypothetical protein